MSRALKVSYSDDVGEGGVAVNREKNTIFPEHPVCYSCNDHLKVDRLFNITFSFHVCRV